MLQALFLIFDKTSSALGILLSLNIKLADGVYVQAYYIYALLFAVWLLYRFMKRAFDEDASNGRS